MRKLPRWFGPFAALSLLLVADGAFAALSSRVELHGKVSDFDDHFVYIDAITERYKIKRGDVPDSVNLRPGETVGFEIPLEDLRIIPATAPAIPRSYKPPRKRTPAQD